MADGYIPPLRYHFLTRFYDLLCSIIGLGDKFRKDLLSKAALPSKGKLLDIGCGTGIMTRLYKTKYHNLEVTGLDPDMQALRIAKSKALQNNLKIKYIHGSAEKLPFPNESFDVITTTLAIHHLKTPQKIAAFREMYRILRKGGRLIVTDFGKPKGLLMTMLMWIPLYIEEGKDNYEGKIPLFIKQAKFRNIRLSRAKRNIDFIEAIK
ncbi:methyltransferase domain-containing protein [Candidatus Woesearchaeota archaeon]|nr:methyltransferase domain-containing protein [Candidatus Woesearchaeota archaeon]